MRTLPTATAILAALRSPPTTDGPKRPDPGQVEIMDPILALHANNAQQWNREDDARRDAADDAVVAAAKRDIARLNRARHGYI